MKEKENSSVGGNDLFMKKSAPTVETLLNAGIDVYYAKQEDGDMIITKPGCLHSVQNYASGFAMARNYHCDEFYRGLPNYIKLYTAVSIRSFVTLMSIS